MDLNKAGLACAAALCLTACGYVGEPLYPALHIPTATVDLTAMERGNNLDVNFTIPALTTEGLIVKQIGGVELRIGPSPSMPFEVGKWSNSAVRIAVAAPDQAGPVHVSVPVQRSFIGQEMVLGVRTIGAKGRASDWSNLVTLTVEPPVGNPVDFTSILNEKGVLLTWKAPGRVTFRILRKAQGEPQLTPLATAADRQYLDTTAEYGTRYEYWVKAVGGRAESELTGPLAVTPEDMFPPVIPAGVSASAGLQTIELAWERNTEPDFKGYRVYRRIGAGSFEKIAELIEAPSFSDKKVVTGKRYGYVISSVDQAGNESGRALVVEMDAP